MTQILKETQTSFHTLAAFLIIATTLSLASCSSSEAAKSDVYAQATLPSDFQLTMGEGGGFTGQWNGFVVDSAGTVSSWRGTSPDQNVKRTGKLARPQFDKLWQIILNTRFFDIDTTGTGNMTVAIQVTAGGTTHRTSWAKPSGTRPRLAPVQMMYDSCRTIVSRAK
jgi:hypothetical protein